MVHKSEPRREKVTEEVGETRHGDLMRYASLSMFSTAASKRLTKLYVSRRREKVRY